MTKLELTAKIENLKKEIAEYIKDTDPRSYSYPFHMTKELDGLVSKLELYKTVCPYCPDGDTDLVTCKNGLCNYHNYFYGNK